MAIALKDKAKRRQISKVQVKDFTASEEVTESAALIYFEELQGLIHVYRDGTVVLSSPAGVTVSSLQRADDALWRREQFIGFLTRMGVSDRELTAAARMIVAREETLSRLDFSAAVEGAASKSTAHFKDWCQQRGLDYESMTEEKIDRLLMEATTQVRAS